MVQNDYENLTPEEKWEKATIANNFIFYKVMRNNPDVCKELLEILLQIKIDHIDMKQEESILVDYGKKGVRLDVYAVYTFENICIENPEIKLNDRTYKYFFIAKNYDKILDEEQKAFLKLVISNESTGDFANRVSKLVDDAKHNTQWRKQFMDMEIEKRYAFREGEAKGAQQKAIEDATNMLKKNYPVDDIAEVTSLPLQKVLELQSQIK